MKTVKSTESQFINEFPSAQDMKPSSPKRMLAYQIEREMARQNIGRAAMAEKMGTSRAQLNRLLDADNPSVTLQTIETAARVLGLRVVIDLSPLAQGITE